MTSKDEEEVQESGGPRSKSLTKKEGVSALVEIDLQSFSSTDIEEQLDVEQVAQVKKSKEASSSIIARYFSRNSVFQPVNSVIEKPDQTEDDTLAKELADGNRDGDEYNKVGGRVNLSEDTFSFMKIKPILSRTWFFATVVYLMQLLLVAMILSQQIYSSREGTPFDIPFKVDGTTRVAQVMAIIFIVFMSKDVVMPIREISLLWISNDKQWSKVIGLVPNDTNSRQSWLVWVARILLPNFLQFAQGTLMLVISFIIIIQTDDVISLFADFAAMFIISDLDNIAFELAKNGYFGEELIKDAHLVQNLELEDQTSMLFCYLIPLRPLILVAVFLITLGSFIPVVWNQVDGTYFRNKFPHCAIESTDILKIGDGFCDGGLFNSFECGFDGGDCALFNVAFPSCKVQNPQEIGDGICQEQYKSDECGFDSLDCCEGDKSLISNGVCNPLYNTAICSWDGGDCKISGFEFCHVNSTEKIGDGECDGLPFNTAACGWDGSDCLQHNQNFIVTYPNCIVFDSTFVGNGRCDGGDYMEEACNFDGGDCDAFMEKYPDCNATDPWRLGDGKCDLEDYMTYECGWDGGDCIDQQFPNCTVSDEYKALLGDGVCQLGEIASDSEYSRQVRNPECGFDGGDCETYYRDIPQ